MNRSTKVLILSFLISVLTLGFGLSLIFPKKKEQKTQSRLLGVFRGEIPVNPNIINPSAAKKDHLFWITQISDTWRTGGVAVSGTGQSSLFPIFFPGYPDKMRTDEKLWRDYFKRIFLSRMWINHFHKEYGEQISTFFSAHGCLDILHRYGGDFLFLGSSGVYRSIIPDYVGELLKRNEKTPRILNCARGVFSLTGMKSYTGELLRVLKGKKIKQLSWGFPTWGVNVNSPIVRFWDRKYVSQEVSYLGEISRTDFFRSFYLSYEDISLSSLIGRFPINELFPGDLTSLSFKKRNSQKRKNAIKGLRQAKIYFNRKYYPMRDFDKFIEGKLPKLKPFPAIASLKPDSCDVSEASQIVDGILEKTKRVADNVLIYLQPANPIDLQHVPKCFQENVVKMLESKKGPGIAIETRGWKQYGLEYSDFVRTHRSEDILVVDGRHTNLFGARKITKAVVEMLAPKGLEKK